MFPIFMLIPLSMLVFGAKKTQVADKTIIVQGILLIVLAIAIGFFLLNVPWGGSPPEVCTMPAGMVCTPAYFDFHQNGYMNITLVNNLQKTIIITSISCTKNSNQFEQCDATRCSNFSGDGVTVPLRSPFKALVACNDENGNPMKFEPGDSYNGKINVEYYFLDEGSEKKRTLSGNIYARAS
jgi:hypothetical protein